MTSTSKHFADAREHLKEEFHRLELLARIAAGEDSRRELEQQEKLLQKKLESSRKKGIVLPLEILRDARGLSELEINAVLTTAGASLSPELSRLYAGLENGPFSTGPTPALIARLFSLSFEETSSLMESLLNATPVNRFRLLYFSNMHANRRGENTDPLMTTPLACATRLLTFLLGNTSASEDYASVLPGDIALENLPMTRENRAALQAVQSTFAEDGISASRGLVLHLFGAAGAGKKEAAAAVCASADVPCLHVDLKSALRAGIDAESIMDNTCREAFLLGAAIMISDWQIMDTQPGVADWRHTFLERASHLPTPVFISSSPRSDFDFENKNRLVELELTPVPRMTRERIWSNYLNGLSISETLPPEYLAGAFSFTPGQIQSAFEYARNRERLLRGSRQISEQELLAGCRAMSNRSLSKLAVRVTHRFDWNDLILPAETMDQLRDIPGHLRHGRVVHEEWQMDLKSTGGRGLNALFSGPSGTGKTMAASIIAADLKLEMYRVDLSSIISKYVGETEKNLGKIFAEAEGSNAILFFDEADSLFGKRGDVKDAHDRYANTEVNYLLQKMEDFQGITILATNLRENIDEAFLRRLHFIVEFPFPDVRERIRIWRGVFTADTPMADNVDPEFLGKVLRVPGGNIMSIARNAAFLAAADGRAVGMNQILRAAKREFEKEGRPFIPAELGPYRDYLRL